MSDHRDLDDVELARRIRRSMQHYRMRLPVESAGSPRPRGAPRAALAVAAVILLGVGFVAALGLTPIRPIGGAPHAQPSLRSTPSVAAPIGALLDERDVQECLENHGPPPEEWRLPGETREAAFLRIQNLPVLIRQPGASLLGDDTYYILCEVTPEGRGSGAGPVSAFEGSIRHLAGDSGEADGEWLQAGAAAAAVARVEVVLRDGTILETELVDGFWMVKWSGDAPLAFRAFAADGRLLGEIPPPTG